MSGCLSHPLAEAPPSLSDVLLRGELAGCPAPHSPGDKWLLANALCADANAALGRAAEAERAAELAAAAEAAGESFLASLAKASALRAAEAAEAARHTWEVCAQCNGVAGRDERVIVANFSASGRKICCNVLDRDGNMQCIEPGSLRLLLVPVAMLALALCIALLRVSRRARVLREKRYGREMSDDGGDAEIIQFEDDVDRARSKGQEATQAALARRLLSFGAPPLLDERLEVMKAWSMRLGFQPDNVANQMQHLTSLIVSNGAANGGDYARAVDALHAKVMGPIERWRAHVEMANEADALALRGKPATPMARLYGGDDGRQTIERRNEGKTYAGVVTSNGPMSSWVRLSTAQQLHELSLFFLIWGEAANLRFMPELLYTLFELARAHVPDTASTTSVVSSAAPPAGGLAAGVSGSRRLWDGAIGVARRAASLRRSTNASAEPNFLAQVVRPIYEALREARSEQARHGHSYDVENYDDWNEAFWRRERGLDELYTRDGERILAQPPPDRWAFVLRADWRRFLVTTRRKTHRELRFWWCLLAANRRIFLLHFTTFLGIAAWTMPFIKIKSWDYNGWDAFRVLAIFWLLAPASALFGRFFERWARDTEQSRARLSLAFMQMIGLSALCGYVLWLQSQVPIDEFRELSLGDGRWNAIVGSSTLLTFLGLPALFFEMAYPTPPERDALDARPFFERRMADTISGRTRWIRRDRSTGIPYLAPEVWDVILLNGFWIIVWGLKITAARLILMPILLESHSMIVNGLPLSSFTAVYGTNTAAQILLRLQPRMLLRAALQVLLWATGGAIYLADTLGWYQLVLGLWGGFLGLFRHGVAPAGHFFNTNFYEQLKKRAHAKLLSALASSQDEVLALASAAEPDRFRRLNLEYFGSSSKGISGGGLRRVREAWKTIWSNLIDDLYGRCLLSREERDALCYERPVSLASDEAVRRLRFFARSLQSSDMPTSNGALQAAGISVLVPVYAEPILPQLPPNRQRELGIPLGEEMSHKHVLDEPTLKFLESDFDLEWNELRKRLADKVTFSTPAHKVMRVRTWAAERLQTVYRTVQGMMKHRAALEMLLAAELPSLSEDERQRLLDLKFRLVLAVQTYANHHADSTKSNAMDDASRADVELLLERFPRGLTVAYIIRIDEGEGTNEDGTPHSTFYSCLIDGARRSASGDLEPDPDNPGLLQPTFRVELPGFPILGNGKSDNQNMAVHYTRGALIQAIDCNQEGYLEESLKIANVLREFDLPIPGGGPPAIVGFREHIFSGLGTLGTFAATAELVFGTLVQRTLARPLWCRYHYGHPDVMDKLALVSQGGLSKATKGLNLSEDIFAGMDAQLRGQNIVHREYFQVGKGRDMGSISILQFFSKLSQGTAQMSTSRQALRLGQRLSLGRLLGFYYTHIGYYAGQLHYFHANYMLLALSFVGGLLDATGALPHVGPPSAALFNTLFGFISLLFFAFNLLPSFFALLSDEGFQAALAKPLHAILTFSPLFFVMQSRCIGHYFSLEFAVGGAKYIPTGRGLAISHTPFHEVYATHAASCLYPGVDVLFLLLGTCAVAFLCGYALNPWSIGFAGITPAALLLGPSLFNPHAFRTLEGLDDLRRYLLWLVRATKPGGGYDPRHSWADFHQERADAKHAVKWGAFILPSKEMLLSLPLLLASYVVMTPYGWGIAQLVLLGTPLLAFFTIDMILMPFVVIYAALWHDFALAPAMARASASFRLEIIAALLCATIFVVECFHWEAIDRLGFATKPASLPIAHGMLLFTTRYFSFRWTCNTTLYLAASLNLRAIEKRDVADARGAGTVPKCVRLVPDAIIYVFTLVGAGYLFLIDAVLGIAIQLVYIALGLIPGSALWHYGILGFSKKVRDTANQQRGLRSTAATLVWLAGKNAADKARADRALGTSSKSSTLTHRVKQRSAREAAQMI